MRKIFDKKRKQGGYTLLELLFYISFFALLSLVTINAMITMTKSFKETSIQAEFLQSGTIMERISREIRQAYEVAWITSGSNMLLNTTDESGAVKTVSFLLSGTDLQLTETGVFTGNLNSPNISVTALTFTKITTAKGVAVKVSMTIVSKNDTSSRPQNFYDTVVLRGTY